ncbi:lipoprotein [Pseudomonas oryzihabitans]|nr:lipoprotein [Pseudomonas psychrotolerans]KTT40786.1 lipoprotein [Pseudomonas psychrotolerans]
MKARGLVLGVLAAAALAGCAGRGGHQTGGWTHWVCDSKAAFDWRYVDRSQSIVDLKLESDGLIRHLNREPATDGQSYTDGLLAFHIRGDQGLVYWIANNDLIGRGCRTP